MKILNLKIEGFRSLKSIDWSLGDLNVVIGPNNSGKSNLLQGLEMISASARGKLAKFIKTQGGMEPVVWDGKAESINIKLETSSIFDEELEKGKNYFYDLELSRLGKKSVYRIEKEYLSPKSSEYFFIKRTPTSREVYSKNTNYKSIEELFDTEVETLVSSKLIPEGLLFRDNLISWYILSYFSNLETGNNSLARQSFVTSYEKNIDHEESNFIAVLHTLHEENRDFKNEINQAMNAAFGGDFERLSFLAAGDTRLQLRIHWKSLKKSRSAADISDGTLRFLYLLTVLSHPEPPALIAIDEPETGLHPSMFPIIAEYATEAARKTQVILTTHSPEFLSAFGDKQKEVRVTVSEWEEGQTKLRVLKGETLAYWLKEYSLGELYRSGQLEDME